MTSSGMRCGGTSCRVKARLPASLRHSRAMTDGPLSIASAARRAPLILAPRHSPPQCHSPPRRRSPPARGRRFGGSRFVGRRRRAAAFCAAFPRRTAGSRSPGRRARGALLAPELVDRGCPHVAVDRAGAELVAVDAGLVQFGRRRVRPAIGDGAGAQIGAEGLVALAAGGKAGEGEGAGGHAQHQTHRFFSLFAWPASRAL